MNARAKWVDEVKASGVVEIAERLGMEVQVLGGRKPRIPCPSCKEETRHRSRGDRRLAADVVHDGSGWYCFNASCGARGDAIDLVAYAEEGSRFRDLAADARRRVAGVCIKLLGMIPSDVRERVREPRAEPEPAYPPLSAVMDVWELCRPLDSEPAGMRWCAEKRIDLATAVEWDNVRVLPDLVRLPECASKWSWFRNRLVAKMYDAHGHHVSLEARRPFASNYGPKAMALGNELGERRRLVFAAPAGVAALQSGEFSGTVLWVEGPKKMLQAQLDNWDAAVIGIVSGSVTAELLSRFPRARHVILTDPDSAGAKLATAIVQAATADQRRNGMRIPRGMRWHVSETSYEVRLGPELQAIEDERKRLLNIESQRAH